MKPSPANSPVAGAPGSVGQSKIENQKSKTQRVLAYRRLWLVAFGVYALDQLTKHAIEARLPFPTYGPPAHVPVIDGFFNLVHVGNTGAAWSILSGRGHWLGLLAVATLVAIYFWRHSLGLRHGLVQLCFGGLCGGTVGNLTDRLRVGHVVDFLDFHFGSYIYPSFNVADIGIVCGVFGYILWSLKQPTPPAERIAPAGR
ncbi:signal peptidase II [Oleiharenicola sp. Vm1]|uniref:signal peptidase II n=1 Tax=Oleiharenicola sp. Vm1 TaxID=3398393 RepID=UPI0039F6406E